MKTLKKIYLVSFLIGSLLTSALFVQGQFSEAKSNYCDCGSIDPFISAGSDASVCDDDSEFSTNGASNIQGKTIWKTTGDGVFENPHSLKTVYTPGEQDIANGQVTLYLILLPNGSNEYQTVYDSMILYIGNCLGNNETK